MDLQGVNLGVDIRMQTTDNLTECASEAPTPHVVPLNEGVQQAGNRQSDVHVVSQGGGWRLTPRTLGAVAEVIAGTPAGLNHLGSVSSSIDLLAKNFRPRS